MFKLDSSGHETLLHSFTNSGGDGVSPFAALIMDTAGNLYGTADLGGASGFGTMFKLMLASAPTISSILPKSAIAGGAAFTLTVIGLTFVGGSTVNFNGHARATTFVSATQLTASILAWDVERRHDSEPQSEKPIIREALTKTGLTERFVGLSRSLTSSV